jgi:hypothetical protein
VLGILLGFGTEKYSNDEYTDLCSLVLGILLSFGTEKYSSVIFLSTEEYKKIEEDTMFSVVKFCIVVSAASDRLHALTTFCSSVNKVCQFLVALIKGMFILTFYHFFILAFSRFKNWMIPKARS